MPSKSNNYFLPLSFLDNKKHSTGKNLGYIRFFRSPRDVITHTLRGRFHFTGTMIICGTLGRRTIWLTPCGDPYTK